MKNIAGPYAVRASYTPQKITRMQANILIEALPAALNDDDLLQTLCALPDFSPLQREWEVHDRIQQIKGLSNFLVPLNKHLELARTLDTMIREGYVSRSPRTAMLQEKLQQMYALQKAGKTFSQVPEAIGAQDSVALIGMPGMGKSTTVKRCLARYPRVIDHGDGIVQIPYIHVDMTSNGTSVKSLAIAIISQIDRLLPDCKYAQLYLTGTGRTSTESLIHAAARLVAIHHVGIIVADEVQNLSPVKGVQTVMTELVTMCNTLTVPLVFIGTYKAEKILGADFRSCRRATGGLAAWGPLLRYDSGALVPGEQEPSEWDDFVRILWNYQWVKHPVLLTKDLLDYLHDRTQGVIDLVIKLVAIAQVRAITSGVESVGQELLEEVYQTNFGLLHEALEAMRNRKGKAMERFADLRPVDLDTAVRKYEAGAQMQQQALRPKDADFAPTVTKLLIDGGINPETATRLALEAGNSGRSDAPLQAVAKIVKEIQPKLPRASTKGKVSGEVIYPDFSTRPDDYRRAAALAAQKKTDVVQQLKSLGMLVAAEELVPIF